MTPHLLQTKLQIPPQPHHGIRRTRLTNALEDGLSHYKLILIAAPAGYGKTTLLSQWAAASRFPIAWLSLSEEDNDLDRFLRYLLAAWEKVQPDVQESQLELLLGSQSPDSEAVLPAFINVANSASNDLVFVLDDYHLIEDPAIHQALTFLLDHLPHTHHFVLTSRAEPRLPLARYRARHELLEFHAEELQFLPEETVDFLSQMMQLEISHDEVMTLQAQLEGWIAGLQLVALTLQRRLAGTDKLVVTGKHRFIADYLGEDVLAPLPDNVRQFLLQTSILDRLCVSLCEAVTERADSREMLQRLERENLFLMPLDDNREWYRYHPLFADFLQEELKLRCPDDVIHLHRRASHWYLAHDLPEPAFDHALAGADLESVIRVFELYTFFKLHSGELKVLARWLDSLPAEWYVAYPPFMVAQASLYAFTGAFEACVRCLEESEQRLLPAESKDARWQLAMVTSLQCVIACVQNDLGRARLLADQALQDLREGDLSFRASIYHALGDTYRSHGHWEEAQACYLKVLGFTHRPDFRLQSAHVFGALADLELLRGKLRKAADYWRQALTAVQDQANWGRLPLPVTGWVFIRLGEILYEWNELEAASEHLSRGLERSELGGDVRAMLAGYLLAGRLKLIAAEIASAADYLEQARLLVESASFTEWNGRFERFQLELWLVQDRLRTAVNWADEKLRGDMGEERPESEEAHLAVVRVLIVKGDTPAITRALTILERLLQVLETEGRMGVQIEALALQALAYWRRGEQASAMTALEHALRLAEPEGYMRLFADLGLPMARVLQEARSRAVMPHYVKKLLAVYNTDLAFSTSNEQTLLEPLSLREQEVLQLIAAGLTNREIAAALVVSPETVKKHAGNIYSKLGVRSRTEAAAKAREMDLLS